MLSIIIPTLNAARHLPRSLPPLVEGVWAGLVKEVIVSDGGSRDETLAMAEAAGCEIVAGPAGRGVQLRAGANIARGDWFLFLHADTALEEGWSSEAQAFMVRRTNEAAAFAFSFDDDSAEAKRIAAWVRLRCAALKLPYGDQGLLISRSLYESLGGFNPFPLMEDVDLVRRIGGARLRMLKSRAFTSAEKYRQGGYSKRAWRNLSLLVRFYLGADPEDLAKSYD